MCRGSLLTTRFNTHTHTQRRSTHQNDYCTQHSRLWCFVFASAQLTSPAIWTVQVHLYRCRWERAAADASDDVITLCASAVTLCVNSPARAGAACPLFLLLVPARVVNRKGPPFRRCLHTDADADAVSSENEPQHGEKEGGEGRSSRVTTVCSCRGEEGHQPSTQSERGRKRDRQAARHADTEGGEGGRGGGGEGAHR